ncbi:MAG TPA: cytochrome P450, partial [Pusillimonas sp.]|nr:cytochrome P450 [Pusillimonas sp.]
MTTSSSTTTLPDSVPRLDIDPFGDDFLTMPYPYHEQMREAGEAVWLDSYGLWA